MLSAQDAVTIYRRLADAGIPAWIIGGWGIDALLGEETRPHKDIDILVLVDDARRMRDLLKENGFELIYLWPENHAVTDSQGVETDTAFVLRDGAGREMDVHAMWLDADGNGVPEWGDWPDFRFWNHALAARGSIAGISVPCITPQMQVACHTGYALPESHQKDMERLRERFDLD
jgi:lincosamide nucleotidyltransferase A/C/D/E